ncbi:uncharacterized protein LOC110767132 [Prunus avium]|uniref:Uncharacterized protein LOC110767132 n=1 Tax=Prunus avium TaxID=42229 RepID=A0A6P5TFZ9_PRUAV|nr:uncharacterized protein LOC110767132 [Prunus avium]
MNPKKCAFGVTAGNFLGFLVHQRGIEVDKNKATAIMAAPPPRTKKELQSFLGKVNFLRRFISNLAGKIRPLSPLLKLKDTERFVWGTEHQVALDDIKKYLSQPPVLMPPKRGKPLRLYILASEGSIGCLLAQNNESGREQAVHYLSRTLNTAELNYSPIEKLCLALYFAATELRHYMLPSVVQIISRTDLIKYMLTRPIIRGRIGKWTMALSEFTFQYVAQKSVKGQALADFLAHYPAQGQEEELEVEIGMARMEKNYWTMYFDDSSTEAEYEAHIIGLEILKEMKATRVLVYGDSQLVVNQLTGEYQCTSENLAMYYVTALNTADSFSRISFVHIPRAENGEANEMAQVASGVNIPNTDPDRVIRIERRTLPALAERGMTAQNELYRKGSDGLLLLCPRAEDIKVIMTESHEGICGAHQSLLLLCPSAEDIKVIMTESHEGICGAHQSGVKMRWLVRRHGYYWPTILKDCIEYAKGCIKCQIYGPIQRVPAEAFHPVIQRSRTPSSSSAEASNKVIKGILEKMIEEKPRAWHDLLPEALWAYRTSKRSATSTSPYTLTYGHDAIVPMELKVRSLHVAKQREQEKGDYAQAMAQELEDLEQSRLDAYNLMQAQK